MDVFHKKLKYYKGKNDKRNYKIFCQTTKTTKTTKSEKHKNEVQKNIKLGIGKYTRV